MGTFDTVTAELACPVCETTRERRIQVKHGGHWMESYRVGDFVIGAPAGQPLLRGMFWCDGEGQGEEEQEQAGGDKAAGDGEQTAATHRVETWIHLDRGFLTDVTLQRPERATEVAWWMIERAGWDATDRRRALRAVRNLLAARRRRLEAEARGEADPDDLLPSFPRVESEEELLDTLASALERAEERAWPWARGEG